VPRPEPEPERVASQRPWHARSLWRSCAAGAIRRLVKREDSLAGWRKLVLGGPGGRR